MLIVPTDAGGIEILEPLDFKRFSVRAAPGQTPANSAAVVFASDEPVAWVSEVALRTWPGAGGLAGWGDGLTAMIDYARTKGWFDAEAGRVRAHVERC